MSNEGEKTIEIRIREDGKVFFSELPEEMLELALGLNPEDLRWKKRFDILRQARAKPIENVKHRKTEIAMVSETREQEE